MAGNQIPRDVARLLATSVRSIAELEALLYMRRRPDAWYDPNALADLVYLDRSLAEPVLRRLHSAGLVRRREGSSGGGPAHYQYAPGNAELLQAVDRLAELYAERRLMVLALVAARTASGGLRQFSDAFRLWKR